jgi:hypothetical protein
MKVKGQYVGVIFLIFIILFGIIQSFVPVTEGQKSNLIVDQEYWRDLASNAWKYFQPGIGLDSATGLQSSGLDFPFFTDWDLGIYIQSIIDVSKMGILSSSGNWGSDARFNKILTFLQTRQLTPNGLPYAWYKSDNGNPNGTEVQNAADSGELLVALDNLRVFRPDLANAINTIVYNRTNYSQLEQAVDSLNNSKNLYDYYVASGFASFWPSRFLNLSNSILDNIVSAPTVSTYGVTLPLSKLTCEPLLLSLFDLAPNSKLQHLADQVYAAHEARYNATGKFVAFSEGNTGLDAGPTYVYEWVVKPDGSTWTIDDIGQVKVAISPIIYFKSAVGLLALHDTSFTENMALYVESHLPNPNNGYSDGIDENGRVDTFIIDKTNAMIIEAALYAINHLQNPTPTPSSTSTPTSFATASPTSLPTQYSSPTPTPNPTPAANTVTVTKDNGDKIEVAIKGNITRDQISEATIKSYQATAKTNISFILTGPSGTIGFSNMSIPKSAIRYGAIPIVYIDNQQPLNQGYTQDNTNFYVWYTTLISTNYATIQFSIPAAPQETSLGLVLFVIINIWGITLLLAAIVTRRKGNV